MSAQNTRLGPRLLRQKVQPQQVVHLHEGLLTIEEALQPHSSQATAISALALQPRAGAATKYSCEVKMKD